jgi:hypothetical protein
MMSGALPSLALLTALPSPPLLNRAAVAPAAACRPAAGHNARFARPIDAIKGRASSSSSSSSSLPSSSFPPPLLLLLRLMARFWSAAAFGKGCSSGAAFGGAQTRWAATVVGVDAKAVATAAPRGAGSGIAAYAAVLFLCFVSEGVKVLRVREAAGGKSAP